jgi:sarcosine oxidase
MPGFDVIVVGGGGIGAAAAFHLARRGAAVLVLDRFPIAHALGSSHGQTRLIRLAYFEHPDYVPLLRRGYELWRQLEQATGRRLLVENGLLMAGPPDGEVIAGSIRSAEVHGLAVERLSPTEAMRRFPTFRLPDEWSAVYEPRGGHLFVEECVRAHADEAIRAGARFDVGVTVTGWRSEGRDAVVETDRGDFRTGRLVLAPGAWAAGLLRLPGVPLAVLRKSLFWYRPRPEAAEHFTPNKLPCFAFDTAEGFFYGFPAIDGRGVKVAEHTGGRNVSDPLAIDRGIDDAERWSVEQAIASRIPSLGRDLADHAACLYTMSPDRHFILGVHPNHDGIVIAAGFSGHGFKFAPVIGEAIADLALEGRTVHPIGFLSPARFARGAP